MHTFYYDLYSSDVLVANFPEGEFSIRETDSIISVCVNLTSGPKMKERNVSLNIFSTDGSASGKCVCFIAIQKILFSGHSEPLTNELSMFEIFPVTSGACMLINPNNDQNAFSP